MNASIGREALKCALPLTNRWQEGIPLNIASPYMHPLTQDTSSQMGGISASPDTLYAKRRCISERAETLPEGEAGE